MSLELVLSELRLLRGELAELSARVASLEIAREDGAAGSGSITVNYLGSPVASESGPASSAPATPAAKSGARQYTEQERIEAAERAGQFLKRGLGGGLVGTSSRDQLNIQSRVYILRRDILASATILPKSIGHFPP